MSEGGRLPSRVPLRAWLGPARLPFLLLTPACVVLGVAWSVAMLVSQGMAVPWWDAVWCLLGALSAHVAVNALNEHADFRSGLDLITERTPFSGGSGALPAHPELVGFAWRLGVGGLLVTALIGLHLLASHPGLWWRLMPLGLTGLMLAVVYTPWLTRHPWLCLMAPGLGFGPLMVLGCVWVMLPPLMSLDARVLALSLVPMALVNNLLLLNQFPDVAADARSGRLTLPMLLGRRACLPWLALRAWCVTRQHAEDTARLLPALGMNVAVALLTPSLMAIGMVMASW